MDSERGYIKQRLLAISPVAGPGSDRGTQRQTSFSRGAPRGATGVTFYRGLDPGWANEMARVNWE